MSRRVVAGLAAGTLLFTACTPDPTPPVPPTGPPAAAPQGEIAIRGCTPEQPLLPAATVGPCGLRVTEAVNARLTLRDPETGAPVPDLAAAIDTEDSQNFTIRLAQGRTFHDGTEVRARNFVAAWNWAAYGPNAMPSQNWFEVIEGAGELICPKEGPCGKDGRPTSMDGLAVLDDHTFTIRTTRPIVDLPTRLAHPVFSPLPDAFFAEDEGKEAFGRLPVGAGPFRIAGNTGSEISLEAAAEYAGDARPQVRTVVLRNFNDQAAGYDVNRAYNEVVSNSLDFTDVIPTDQLVDDVWKRDLAGRFGEQETPTLEAVSFVATDPKLADPRLRQAISMAIDREALARQVFAGTRGPATSWVSPTVPGYRADACGRVCDYNLSQARHLYEEAGGYPGEFQLAVNADGGHKPWADSVCNQLKNALGLDCQVNLLNSQADAAGALQAGRVTGLIRQGWTMDSLSARSHLELYDSQSRLNLVGYDNPAFDAALDAALTATTQAAANEAYRNAELLLAGNPPAIPLWFSSTPHGWSTRVADVRVTPNGSLDLSSIRRT